MLGKRIGGKPENPVQNQGAAKLVSVAASRVESGSTRMASQWALAPPALECPTPLNLTQESYVVFPPEPLVLRNLCQPKAMCLGPIPEASSPTKSVEYVSEGSVLSTAPHHAFSLSVSFYSCSFSAGDSYLLYSTLSVRIGTRPPSILFHCLAPEVIFCPI